MNKLAWYTNVLTVLVLIVFACGPKGHQASEPEDVARNPGMNEYVAGEPGETRPLARPYDNAPPLVPHSTDGMTLARTQNDCLDCHIEGDEVDDGHVATKIPASHFVNEFTGTKTTTTVVGNRYYCLQCHVPQANPSYSFPRGRRE